MSKLNSNEVFYWCHRETPFFACSYSQGGQQICRTAAPSRNQFVFFPRWYFASFTDWRTVSLRPPGHPSPSQREGPTGDPGSPGLKSLMTNGRLLCFFFLLTVPDQDDRPRGCRVWQRAGPTTCCPTVVSCTLGSCPLQVTTQASPHTVMNTHYTCTVIPWGSCWLKKQNHTKKQQ